MTKTSLFLGLFFLLPTFCICQTFLPFAAGNSGNTTWTAGELAITTSSEGDKLATQGFQQPELSLVVKPPAETAEGTPPNLAYFNGVTSTSPTGGNDAFLIEGIGQYPDNKLMIINRWGDLIYETDNYLNDWKGTDQGGNAVPQGTYYYILQVPEFKEVKGSIHVIR